MCTVLLIWYINKCADHFFPLLFHVITAYTRGNDWFTEPAKCEQTARIWKSTQPITHLASTKQIYNLLNQFLCDLLSSVSTWFVCSLLGHVTTVSPLGKPWKILQFTEQIYLQFTDWMNGSVNCIIFWALFRPHNHRAKLWRSTTKLPLWPIATSTPNTPVALGSSDTSISSVSSIGMVSWQVVRMRTRFFIPSVHFLPPLAFIRLSFGFAAIVRLSFGWFVQLFFGGFATSLLTPPPSPTQMAEPEHLQQTTDLFINPIMGWLLSITFTFLIYHTWWFFMTSGAIFRYLQNYLEYLTESSSIRKAFFHHLRLSLKVLKQDGLGRFPLYLMYLVHLLTQLIAVKLIWGPSHHLPKSGLEVF